MNLYILITHDIHRMGGLQLYTYVKATELEKMGWIVKVLFDCNSASKEFDIEGLEKYKDGNVLGLDLPAPCCLNKAAVNNVLKHVDSYLGDCSKYEHLYIESHDDKGALWGELIASKIGGKHLFVTLCEEFHSPGQFYDSKLDFFNWKYDRGELVGTAGLKKLFEGRRKITDADLKPFWINESPVQDVYNSKVEQIKMAEWNICHIGRFNKPFVPKIIDGIAKFALAHPNKQIQFINVGDTSSRKGLLDSAFSNLKNINVVDLGNVFPIPKSLFKKVDVVIACSGSARCAVDQQTLTIVADAIRGKSIGLLGYETQESIYWDGKSPLTDFDVALERTLIEKVYETLPFNYKSEADAKSCCEQNMEVFQRSNQHQEYYESDKILSGRKNISTIVKWYVKNKLFHSFPNITMKLLNMRRCLLKRNEK